MENLVDLSYFIGGPKWEANANKTTSLAFVE